MKYILILSVFVFNGTMAFSAPSKLRSIEWSEISSKDEIFIYKPKSFNHKSGFVPIKFKAIIKHRIDRVLSVLANEKRKLEWLPALKKVKLLEKKSIQDFTVYYRYHAPWPFKDRDFVVQNLGVFDSRKFIVSIDIKSIDKGEVFDDTVRGITYDGYSIIQPHGKDSTLIETAFLNDFGGFVPKFIINIVQKKWPYKFISQLREQLNKNDIEIMDEFRLDHKEKFFKK